MTLFISFRQDKDSEIYANTGHGFKFQQSLEGELNEDIALSRSGSKLICERGKKGNLYELTDGRYSKAQTFAFTQGITSFEFSDDEQVLLIGLR